LKYFKIITQKGGVSDVPTFDTKITVDGLLFKNSDNQNFKNVHAYVYVRNHIILECQGF